MKAFTQEEIISIFTNITDMKYSREAVEDSIENMIKKLTNHKHELSRPIISRDLQIICNIIDVLVKRGGK